jgi:hypothetical protein
MSRALQFFYGTIDKNNSAFIRKSKQLVRNFLIFPGIFISPFIILIARLALNRWGKQ